MASATLGVTCQRCNSASHQQQVTRKVGPAVAVAGTCQGATVVSVTRMRLSGPTMSSAAAVGCAFLWRAAIAAAHVRSSAPGSSSLASAPGAPTTLAGGAGTARTGSATALARTCQSASEPSLRSSAPASKPASASALAPCCGPCCVVSSTEGTAYTLGRHLAACVTAARTGSVTSKHWQGLQSSCCLGASRCPCCVCTPL